MCFQKFKSILAILTTIILGCFATNNQLREPTKPDTDYTFWGAFQSEHRTDLCRTNLSNVQTLSGIVGQQYRWKDNFYVYIDEAFTPKEYNVINAALYDIDKAVCLGVKIWAPNSKPSGDYVFIKRGDSGTGCWSVIGRIGGQQIINLQYNGCINKVTVLHQLMHAMGYGHEVNRPDRDEHVTIHWENIRGHPASFYNNTQSTTFGLPYDQNSVTHCGPYQDSFNGRETVTAKDGGTVGPLGYLTAKDVQKLRRMYNCKQ